ncbi:MAG: HAMP domain-containing sensor histidine kinase [Bacteriovoracaceae bacterium]
MEKDPLDKDKIKKMIGDIENNFQRILNIIFFQRVYYIKDSDAIFTYAKPEELVLDLKNLFEDRLTKKGITLKIENAIGPGEPFILNKFLILRSISYLIQNSIESMTLDSLEVSNAISIYLEKNGDKLLIKVSDNGKKISEDVVKTMFNPFVSTKDDLTSMGLGLSLVVEILQKIGATIKFQQNGETKEFLIEFF